MSPGRLQGCSRGVFGLTNWEPLRKPGEAPASSEGNSPKAMEGASPGQKKSQAPKPSTVPTKPRTQILAKFNYKKNAVSPLGDELNLKQGEKLVYLRVHADNEHWWLAENSDQQVGYVPAAYMMVIEEVRGLPWLQNREDAVPQEEPVVRKPAVAKTYYCEVCEKKFNGPQPYSAHITSKGHKEELALREENC